MNQIGKGEISPNVTPEKIINSMWYGIIKKDSPEWNIKWRTALKYAPLRLTTVNNKEKI